MLRERSDDILQLAAHFMALVAEHLDKKVPSLSSEAEVALKRYAWPGNVREWEHCIAARWLRLREPRSIQRIWRWNKVAESSRTAGRSGEYSGPVFLEEDNVHFCDGIGGLPVFYFENEVFADRYCTVGGDRQTGKRC